MRIFVFLVSLILMASPVLAQSGPAQLTILPGWRTAEGTHMAAFDIRLAKGWKTYWRSPGDTGIPPRISWKNSPKVSSATIHWPRPGFFESYGTATIGYTDRLVLPVEVTPTSTGGDFSISGEIEIGVCSDVCVPMAFRFQATLATDGPVDPLISSALADVPKPRPGSTVAGLGCKVSAITDGLHVTARLNKLDSFDPEIAVFEHSNKEIWISPAKIDRSGRKLVIAADFVPPAAQPFALDRSAITLTLVGKDSAIEISGCPAG